MANSGMAMPAPDFDPAMLKFLQEVYKQERAIRTEEDIYRLFANVGVGQVDANFEDLLTLMKGMTDWKLLYPDAFTFQLQKTPGEPTRSFADALQDVLAVSKNTATVQERSYTNGYLSQFFHVFFKQAHSGEVKARIAMNIGKPYIEKALRVGRALVSCRDTLYSFKVAGPAGACRTDQIVAYLCSNEDVKVVEKNLKVWRTSDCFGNGVPPAMFTLAPGIGFAEEPPNVPKSYVTTTEGTIKNPSKYDPSVNSHGGLPKNNQRMSFAEFHSHRIWAGLVKWRSQNSGASNQTVRYVSFMHEIYLAYGRKKVDLKKPYAFPARDATEAKWREKYALKNKT